MNKDRGGKRDNEQSNISKTKMYGDDDQETEKERKKNYKRGRARAANREGAARLGSLF